MQKILSGYLLFAVHRTHHSTIMCRSKKKMQLKSAQKPFKMQYLWFFNVIDLLYAFTVVTALVCCMMISFLPLKQFCICVQSLWYVLSLDVHFSSANSLYWYCVQVYYFMYDNTRANVRFCRQRYYLHIKASVFGIFAKRMCGYLKSAVCVRDLSALTDNELKSGDFLNQIEK